jgi:hypothetical protein
MLSLSRDFMLWSSAVLLAGIVISISVWPVLTLGTKVRFPGPYEGWNAYHALHTRLGQQLYPPPDSFLGNNYTPLSYHLLGLFPDPLLAGRAVSLLSWLGVGILTGMIVFRLTRDTLVSGLTALLFLAFSAVHKCDYIARSDPQWLATVLVLAGLYVLIRGDAKVGCVPACATLMFLGGMAKQIVVPLPLAVTWWLFRHEPRSFRVWMVTSCILVLVTVLLFQALYGPNFFPSILVTQKHLIKEMLNFRWVPTILPATFVVGVYLWRARKQKWARLISAYLVVACLWGFYLTGLPAADRNRFFDYWVALCLGAGLLLASVTGRWLAASLIGLMLTILVVLPRSLSEQIAEWSGMAHSQLVYESDREWLASQPCSTGPVTLSRSMSSGSGNASRTGVAEKLSGRTYQVVLLREREFPVPSLRMVFESNYRPVRASSTGWFFVPRT